MDIWEPIYDELDCLIGYKHSFTGIRILHNGKKSWGALEAAPSEKVLVPYHYKSSDSVGQKLKDDGHILGLWATLRTMATAETNRSYEPIYLSSQEHRGRSEGLLMASDKVKEYTKALKTAIEKADSDERRGLEIAMQILEGNAGPSDFT